MEGLVNFPLFIVSALILIIAPGPDFIYVTTRGISEGNRAGVLSAFGVSTGLLIHTLFAAFGLSAIIQTSAVAYIIIKIVGAGYLIFLGLKVLLRKSGNEDQRVNFALKKQNVFRQGVITNVFNPKAIVTFMAFLPQFVDVRIANPAWQFTTLGIIMAIIAVVWFGLVGYFAGTLGFFVRGNTIFQNAVKYISGSVMILLGARLALNKE